jgi:DNA invertase Pin-like site-specific DNA recombinase
MAGQRIGYIRVSSLEQNTERQLEGITLDKIFTDKISGKDTNRPQLQSLFNYIREGDKLYVHSMDRLARNLDDLRKIVKTLTEKSISIKFEKENLLFSKGETPMATLMLSVMGAFAEFERSLLKERQREGIEIAKKKGLFKGRKRCLSEKSASELRKRVANGEKKSVLAMEFKISRETLYKYIREKY